MSASLYRRTEPARVVTRAELDEISAALRDPDYRARLFADMRRERCVEVDNPFRREFRPRRGTE